MPIAQPFVSLNKTLKFCTDLLPTRRVKTSRSCGAGVGRSND